MDYCFEKKIISEVIVGDIVMPFTDLTLKPKPNLNRFPMFLIMKIYTTKTNLEFALYDLRRKTYEKSVFVLGEMNSLVLCLKK